MRNIYLRNNQSRRFPLNAGVRLKAQQYSDAYAFSLEWCNEQAETGLDILAMSRALTHLIVTLADDSDQAKLTNVSNNDIQQIPLLHPADRQKVLCEWNATQWNTNQPKFLHHNVEQQAALTPDKIAIIDSSVRLTYSELNEQANAIAHALISRKVTSGDFVGVYVPRSVSMVIAILGILKAGAAYVPLDVNHPQNRLLKIARKAKLDFVLTQDLDCCDFLQTDVANVLTIESLHEFQSVQEQRLFQNPDIALTPNAPAYIVFTSGSTSEPKGVVGLHKGMCNRLNWVLKNIPLPENAVCCQKAAFSFIDCIGEVFSPLFSGLPLVIIPDSVATEPDLLIDFIADNGITHITTVPTLLRMVLARVEDLGARLPNLQSWTCSGEEFPPDLVNCFLSNAMPICLTFTVNPKPLWRWRYGNLSGSL